MCSQNSPEGFAAHLTCIWATQKWAKNGLETPYITPRKPKSQSVQTLRALFCACYALIYSRLQSQVYLIPLWTHIYATAVANGCNPGCKRLRPEIQPFILTENHLLPPQFSCPSEHTAESSGRPFWTKMAFRRPPQEDSEGENHPK